MSCDNDSAPSIFTPVSTIASHILETFLASHFSASSVGLEVSLISVHNCFWFFMSSCLPRGRFPCFPS